MTEETTTAPSKRGRGRPKGSRNRRSIGRKRAPVPASGSTAASYTDELRTRLAEQVKACPTCGNPTGNKSQLARDVGLSTMSLNKFLNGGRVNSDTVDKVHAYLAGR